MFLLNFTFIFTFFGYSLIKTFGLKGLPKYMRDFCLNLVKTTTEYREKNNIVKKDLIQYLIQLRNNNTETGPDGDEWKINATTGTKIKTYKK